MIEKERKEGESERETMLRHRKTETQKDIPRCTYTSEKHEEIQQEEIHKYTTGVYTPHVCTQPSKDRNPSLHR